MGKTSRLFAAVVLSVLVTLLCVVAGPVYVVAMGVAQGAQACREVAQAWWAFARLPWAACRD